MPCASANVPLAMPNPDPAASEIGPKAGRNAATAAAIGSMTWGIFVFSYLI
jgi:hypothetical protein